MNIRRLPQLQLRPSKRTLIGLAIIFPLLLLLDYGFLLAFAKNQATQDLSGQLQAIHQDLEFQDGHWNITKLYNDTLGAEPYVVLANSGLMVDHGNLPAGFFDTVQTEPLKQLTKPTTLQTEADSRWRLLVKPVDQGGKTLGYIAVGIELGDLKLEPPASADEIAAGQAAVARADLSLSAAVNQIGDKLTVDKDGRLSSANLRLRDVQAIISAFGVVDATGKLSPVNFGAFPFTVTKDEVTRAKSFTPADIFTPPGERYGYLALSSDIQDDHSQTQGVAVVATSFKATERLLQAQVNLVGVLLALFAGTLVIFSAPRFMVRRGTVDLDRALILGEGTRIEFKEVLPAGNSLAKHVAGMANTDGGGIFIGVKDDGEVCGIEATLHNEYKQKAGNDGDRTQKGLHSIDQVERQIINDLRNIISPAPDVVLEKIPYKGKTVLRISVRESKGIVHTVSGVIYIRHTNQTMPAKAEEILRLVRTRV